MKEMLEGGLGGDSDQRRVDRDSHMHRWTSFASCSASLELSGHREYLEMW